MRLAAYGNIGVWSLTAKDYSVGGNQTVNNEVEHDAMYVKFVKEWPLEWFSSHERQVTLAADIEEQASWG